jgi:hypothetical protein
VPPSRIDRTAALVLFIAVCAAYFNAFAGSYQFDDADVLLRDPGVASLSGWLQAQPGMRPLLALTYALNNLVTEAWGLRLLSFHVVNLLIHLVATLLVYAVLRRLTHDDDIVFRDQRLAAFIAALVFALHPAQVESVTYLSGRGTALAAVFALLSMLLWLRGREYEDRRDLHLRSPFAFALALLCKECVVVLPLALLLLARLESGRLRWLGPALRESAGHWIVAIAAIGAAAAMPVYRTAVLASLDSRDFLTHLFTQAHAIVYLAAQMVRVDQLNADPALPLAVAPDATTLALVATVFVAGAVGVLALRRYPVFAFSVLWFFVWIAPAMVLPQAAVAHAGQLYLALIGPALGAARLVLRLVPRTVQWALVPLLALSLGFATWQRNDVYTDEVVFWRDVTDKAPHNASAFIRLGHALAMVCRTDDAEQALRRAFELDPAITEAVMRLTLLRAGTLPGLPPGCATAQTASRDPSAAPGSADSAPPPAEPAPGATAPRVDTTQSPGAEPVTAKPAASASPSDSAVPAGTAPTPPAAAAPNDPQPTTPATGPARPAPQ